MDRMGVIDAAFLDVEDGVAHLHIGSLARFAGPVPDFAQLTELMARKLPKLHRYRQRVRFVPGDLARPVWVDDPHFDLRYHLRHTALPQPGGDDEVRNLVGRLMSQPLDRHRPLWEGWIVEGFADGSWAIVSKVHHCMVDGISGTDLMVELLDPTPDAVLPPLRPWVPAPEPSMTALLREAALDAAGERIEHARSAAALLRRGPSKLGAMARDTVSGLGSYARVLQSAPELSIEGAIGPHRSWDHTSVSLADVKVVREALGGTINDVLLTLTSAGFRALLRSRGDDPDVATIHTLVPVSVRDPDDHRPNNQVTAIVASLPVDVDDPLLRLDAVKAQMSELKASRQAEAGAHLMSMIATFLPAPLVSGALRSSTAAFRMLSQHRLNTVTTNVPGPRHTLYALGRPLLEYIPFVPITHGMRVGVAMLSYDGRVGFGVTGDWATVPDLRPMIQGIDAEMAALLAAAARKTGKTGKSGRTGRARSRR